MIQSDNISKFQQHQHHKWPDVALMATLALLPLLFFWRLVTPSAVDKMHLASGDFTEQYFPLRAFSAQQWVQGQVPLWNPYLYGGQPALADIQSGALYPPHVLQALLLGWGGPLLGREIGFPLWALEWQVIFHFSLAAVGTYLFVRHLGLQNGVARRRARFGGVVASLAFTYGGYLTGFPVQQMTILSVSAWLPWLMWSAGVSHHHLGRILTRQTARWSQLFGPSAWGGLAWSMAILAGHPQTVLYIFYLTLAFAVFGAVVRWQVSGAKTTNKRTTLLLQFLGLYLAAWLATVGLGMLVAAAQLLPTLEFIQHSLRADLSYQAVSAGLPLPELISVLYPGYFGGSPEYVGIVTLVLIALALVLGRPRPPIFFWAGAGLGALLLAFGGHTFLYPLAYLLAPGFAAVRQQERAFLIYSFSAAILAGCGAMVLAGPLSRLARQKFIRFERGIRIVMIIAFILSAFYLFGSARAAARGDEVNLFAGVLRHHLFGLILLGGMAVLLARRARCLFRRGWGMVLPVLWLAFNLFTVNWQFNLEQRAVEPFAATEVVRFLQANLPATGQTLAQGRVAGGGLLPGGNSAAAVYNLQDLTGNTPLQLARVDKFYQEMPSWRMWQLMNVRYVVDNRDIAGEGLSLVFMEEGLNVFEVGDPFPRLWFVSQAVPVVNDAEAIRHLADDTFDLRKSATVAGPLAQTLSSVGESSLTDVVLTPTTLQANVKAAGPQLLVFSQIYYPGWQARLDGQPVELRRVNVVQQGLVVPAGVHTVEVSFEPASFWWGTIFSGIGLLLVGGMLVLGPIKLKRMGPGVK